MCRNNLVGTLVLFGFLFYNRISVTTACHTQFVTSGSYSLSPVDANYWLNSGGFSFNSNGVRLSTDDGSLKVDNVSYSTSGTDDIGYFQENKLIIRGGNITMEASMRTYPISGIPVVVFIQGFPKGLKGSKTDPGKTISGFPSFKLDNQTQQLGYLSFGGLMFGDLNKKFGVWGPTADLNDGLEGSGPLAIFDTAGNALIVSSLDNFMASSAWVDKSKNLISFGIMGGVDALPEKFESRTIVYCSNTGIGDAFEGWGQILQKAYNKTANVTSVQQLQDVSLTHLGYWTDNGAYYYYNTEPGLSYEDTLLNVKKDWINKKIPMNYLQLDSWFYPKDHSQAVLTWDATVETFPSGIRVFQEKLDLPLVAHNRYWSVNTSYAGLNGGFFDFVVGKQVSVPNQQFFWEFLLGHGRVDWGLAVYEQDWLNVEFLTSEILTQDVFMARTWLREMGVAAAKHGLKIQYCMALPRHALQSLESQAVTQARVSNDYLSVPDQWKIGVSSHFAAAVGVAPSKDTFWTFHFQPGNKYNKTESYPTLQTVVAVLSRGPVGPGDMVSGTNTAILLRCCDETGLILKPSKPARAIDDQLRKMALSNSTGVSGELWTTYSNHDNFLYGTILAAGLASDYGLTPQAAGFMSPFAPQFVDSVIYRNGNSTAIEFTDISTFNITVSGCVTSGEPFCLFHTAPVIEFDFRDVALLGDLTKWVPMSENRVVQIWRSNASLAVTLRGKPQELIQFTYSIDQVVYVDTEAADSVGCATFTVITADSLKADNVTTTTQSTGTTWRPTLPPGFDCRFKPPATNLSED